MGSSKSRLSAGKTYRKNKQNKNGKRKINIQIGYQCKLFLHQKKSRFPLPRSQNQERRAGNEGNHTRTEKCSGGKFTYDIHITSPLPLTSLTRPDGNTPWILRRSRRSKWKWTKTLPRSRWVEACNSSPFLSRRFQIDLFLDRISLEWGFRGSAMTNHKKLIDASASPDLTCLSFSKEKAY